MSKFSVNLSTIFTEDPFLERFNKARNHGFSYVECQFPYVHSIEEIQKKLNQHQLSMVLFNLPPGNWEKGDRGMATDASRIQEFRSSVNEGIKYAAALDVPRIHCMAGIVAESDKDTARDVYIYNLYYAGKEMAKHGLTVLIEPINPFDMPGYFLSDIYQAAQILKTVALPNVKLQFDFYHIQRIHGNTLSIYQQFADIIDHIQIADVPGRHQPCTGEMNYQEILQFLNNLYDGYIGLEYTPSGKSDESFEWKSLTRIGG
ncbi:TIM barrel protein [Paenibacillus sp. BSR1-1]|uniref:hydroxypyruvate isomerase family protein n=1 Tax=Paenibacillus sp. BSR1-1 TaxID=3020845 RepID=UPI0025B094CA|nr:TIM barrel protein [Paenibacillus sp. BSR1-1]MDN3016115.1 TIM barrel protein [Paenibacillus sp. BSR1-1]